MSNRLLIFKVPFAEANATRQKATGVVIETIAGGLVERGWGLEMPVDNTINLLPRIVKLR